MKKKLFSGIFAGVVIATLALEICAAAAEYRELQNTPGVSGVDYLGLYFTPFLLCGEILMEASLFFSLKYFLFCGEKRTSRTVFQVLLLVSWAAIVLLQPVMQMVCTLLGVITPQGLLYDLWAFGGYYAFLVHVGIRVIYFGAGCALGYW